MSRELLKLHGGTGGQVAGAKEQDNAAAQNRWITDVLLRLVALLALDRFGDYVSDQVCDSLIQ